MIDVTTEVVQSCFAAAYAVVCLGTAVLARRAPRSVRRFCYVLTAAVGVAPVALLLQVAGVGEVTVGAGQIDLVTAVRNLVAYVVIYGGVATLGGASRRLSAAVVGVALLNLFVTTVAPAVGAGPLALIVLVVVTALYPVVLYLFLRPIWAAAASIPSRQRLLHWKARNLLLFVYGMILLFVYVSALGLITDPVLVSALFQYAGFFFQAGIPAFLVYRLGRVDGDETDLRGTLPTVVRAPPEAATTE